MTEQSQQHTGHFRPYVAIAMRYGDIVEASWLVPADAASP